MGFHVDAALANAVVKNPRQYVWSWILSPHVCDFDNAILLGSASLEFGDDADFIMRGGCLP